MGLKILQIGQTNWSNQVEVGEDVLLLHTPISELVPFLDNLKAIELAKLPQDDPENPPKVNLRFSAVLLTDIVKEEALEPLMSTIEAYSLFQDNHLDMKPELAEGIFRQKILRHLPIDGSPQEKIDFMALNLFSGQYGAKLKIPEIDVNPLFKGNFSLNGNVAAEFSGDFGKEFNPLFTFRYNLGTFPTPLEIWPEYVKEGECELRLEIDFIRRGSLGDVYHHLILRESDLKEPYVLPKDEQTGFYSISVSAKGQGKIACGALHWRYSRSGLGRFVLGGKRYSDEKRQEIFSYFNPGDLKPPLNVYFSGFRGAEGFEGFFMMKSMKAPFLLIADPRLEGGCFYTGTDTLENNVLKAIQESLDYLGFDNHQLILSGLSMGAFGAVYNAAKILPHAVVVGKPFTNLGDTVAGLKLRRPDEFETSGDMILNVIGRSDAQGIEQFNKKFWDIFEQANLEKTKFAIAYMEHDDYDGYALQRIVDHIADRDVYLIAKGYEGRHNDNSRSINRWFISQYHKFLKNDFGRIL